MKKTVVVTLIGRPNVGKSTIFNRLMQKQDLAITYDQPGVTRDRHYALLPLEKLEMEEGTVEGAEDLQVVLVDTGGFYGETVKKEEGSNQREKKQQDLFQRMVKHIKIGLAESDLVCLVVDGREGLLPFDRRVMELVRDARKPFLVLVNKIDTPKQDSDWGQFFSLGVEEKDLFPLSAAHGKGFGDLRQRLKETILGLLSKENGGLAHPLEEMAGQGVVSREKVVGNVTIVGAPNSGKSTLLNHLLGSERALVSPLPGTTVDPITGYFDLYFGKDVAKLQEEEDEVEVEGEGLSYWRSLRLVDTAGIRRKRDIEEEVELQSVIRALRSIDQTDIVIFMIDATKGPGHQDSRLCDIILEKGKSLILCLNKMDLVEKTFKNPQEKKEWWEKVHVQIPWLQWCQVLPLSAKTGKYMKVLRESLKKTVLIRRRKISTGRINQCVMDLVDKHPIALSDSRGKKLKIKYASLVSSNPPTFLLFSNMTQKIPPSYRRYLVNGIREEFGLVGTPIHLIFRKTETERVERNAPAN